MNLPVFFISATSPSERQLSSEKSSFNLETKVIGSAILFIEKLIKINYTCIELNTCFICFFRILAKFIHLDMTNNFNSKNSILSPPPLTLIPMEDSSFIPSTILNPPNRPFRKRYASQLSNSPSNFNRRSSKLYPDLKYTVLYTIFNNISESFLGCNSAANDKPPRSNL